MKRIILELFVCTFLIIPFMVLSQNTAKNVNNQILPKDLKTLLGKWEGTLMYLDYTSGKSFEMPANLKIERGKNSYQLKLYNTYPNEPKANDKDKLVISKDGSLINGKSIISGKTNSNNELEFTVEYSGNDGNENKKAMIRETYIIGNSRFISRKEIKFSGQIKWIKRNEFNYKKTGADNQ